MSITVEIALYSGRPNPVFGLSAADATALVEQIDRLPVASVGTTMPDGLGYRGFRIVATNARFAEAVVKNGLVALRDREGHAMLRTDRGRTLEHWLLDRSAPHLSADEGAWLRDELTR